MFLNTPKPATRTLSKVLSHGPHTNISLDCVDIGTQRTDTWVLVAERMAVAFHRLSRTLQVG